jgi:hypothetical protein
MGGHLSRISQPTCSYQPHRRNPAPKPTPEARPSALPVGRSATAIWHMLAGQR